MKNFAALYRALDASTASRDKQAALQAYLRAAAPADAAWAVYFLAGGKPRQLVPTKVLRELAREAAGLPEWAFTVSSLRCEDCHSAPAAQIAQEGEKASQSTLDLTRAQLRSGYSAQPAALAAEQSWLQARAAHVAARGALLGDTVALYQALGGGVLAEPASD
jgi:outer membrane protein TolC